MEAFCKQLPSYRCLHSEHDKHVNVSQLHVGYFADLRVVLQIESAPF